MGTLTLGASTVNLAPSNVSKAIVATYTDSDSTDTFTLKFAASLPTPGTFTATAITANGLPTLTTTANFNKVRKGDGVSAGAGIAGGTTVAAITHVTGKDTKELVMSANGTADGSRTVTFTPPAPTGEVFVMTGKIEAVKGGTNANDTYQLTAELFAFNGKNEASANPSTSDATKMGSVSGQVHFPSYETAIART